MSVLDPIREDLRALGVHDHLGVALLLYLVYTTRKMCEKLQLFLVGPSSAGKSFLVERVLGMIPKKETMEVAFITKAGLTRQNDLRGRIVLIQEHLEDRDLTKALRLLSSRGEVQVVLGRGHGSETLTLLGPAVVVETATDLRRIDFQNRNRGLVVTVDPTLEELKARCERIKHAQTRHGRKALEDAKSIFARHHARQERLQPGIQVEIPFALRLRFAPHHHHSQRLLRTFFKVVSTIAFLDQENRQIRHDPNGKPYLQATVSDYREAHDLVRSIDIDTGSDILPESAAQFFKDLKQCDRLSAAASFTRRDIKQALPHWTEKRQRTWMGPLLANDLITCTKRGGGPHEYCFTSIGRTSNPEAVFQNCFASLTPPEELERMPSLPSVAPESGQAGSSVLSGPNVAQQELAQFAPKEV